MPAHSPMEPPRDGKAFFSAEAYVNPKWIRVQSVNKKSLKEVSALLDLLNIENKIYEYNPKQIKYSSVGIISIHKKEARKKYLETIVPLYIINLNLLESLDE